MTGLDVDNDVIIEIFCIITNGSLEPLEEAGWGTVIHQSKERMDQMVELLCLHNIRIFPKESVERKLTVGCTRMNGVYTLTVRVAL